MNRKLKLSLLGTLVAGSAFAIAMPIVSCSTAAIKVKATADWTAVTTAATNALKTIITGTYEEQKALYEDFAVNGVVPTVVYDAIKPLVTFKDGEKTLDFDKVIKDLVFVTLPDFPPAEGGDITGIKIKMVINSGYEATETIPTDAGILDDITIPASVPAIK